MPPATTTSCGRPEPSFCQFLALGNSQTRPCNELVEHRFQDARRLPANRLRPRPGPGAAVRALGPGGRARHLPPGRHFIITPLFSPRKTARNCDNQDSKSKSNQLTLEKAPASLSQATGYRSRKANCFPKVIAPIYLGNLCCQPEVEESIPGAQERQTTGRSQTNDSKTKYEARKVTEL